MTSHSPKAPKLPDAERERRNAEQRRRRQEKAKAASPAKAGEAPAPDPNADLDRIADRIFDRIVRKDMFAGLTAALDEEEVEDTVDDAVDAIRTLFDYIEDHGPPGVLDALLNGLDLKHTTQDAGGYAHPRDLDDQIAAIQAAIDTGGGWTGGWTGVGNTRERREEIEEMKKAEEMAELAALRAKYGLDGAGPSEGTVRGGPMGAMAKPFTLTERAGMVIDRMSASQNMLSVLERTLTEPNAPASTAAGGVTPQPGSMAGSLDLIHTMSIEMEGRLQRILDRLG